MGFEAGFSKCIEMRRNFENVLPISPSFYEDRYAMNARAYNYGFLFMQPEKVELSDSPSPIFNMQCTYGPLENMLDIRKCFLKLRICLGLHNIFPALIHNKIAQFPMSSGLHSRLAHLLQKSAVVEHCSFHLQIS